MERFLQWIKLKRRLHEASHKPPYVSERDIWWVSLGQNVGSEINGKSDKFSRLALIYKKLAHGFYFVIPTTTQKREGTWYVHFEYEEKDMYACLHQARAIDHRRLFSKLGQIDDDDFTLVKNGFMGLYNPQTNIPRR